MNPGGRDPFVRPPSARQVNVTPSRHVTSLHTMDVLVSDVCCGRPTQIQISTIVFGNDVVFSMKSARRLFFSAVAAGKNPKIA